MSDSPGVSNDNEALCSQFQEICSADEETARQYLSRCGWNLELSIQEYLNVKEGQPSALAEPNDPLLLPSSSGLRQRLRDSTGDSSDDNGVGSGGPPPVIHRPHRPHQLAAGSWSSFLTSLAQLPFQFLWSIVNSLYTFVLSLVSPRYRAVTDPVADVASFITEFEAAYGARHPEFYRGSYASALADAKKELKFLLVYLHSPRHADTDGFCRSTLCHNDFVQFVDNNAIFWACSINTSEGYRVSGAMRETTYPFLALVCQRGARMMIVLRIEGLVASPHDLIGMLAVAIQDNETYLNLAREERAQSQMSAALRAEQQEAYERSLLEDQQREEAKRQQEAEAVALRLKEEQEAQRVKDVLEERRNFTLPPEPLPGDENCIRISFRYPCGTRFDRNFLGSDTLQLLNATAATQEACPLHFTLVASFPRRAIPKGDGDSAANAHTLSELGFERSTVLLVVDDDA